MNKKTSRYTELWTASLVIPEQVCVGASNPSFVIPDSTRKQHARPRNNDKDALDPLGDTLAVVNVQGVTGTTSEGADVVSRNTQFPEGLRAFLQPKRQIDALDPATRKTFKAQQGSSNH